MPILDANGNYIGGLTDEIVHDCSHAGQCDEDVSYWVGKLDLTSEIEAQRDRAERYLKEFGAWDDLSTVSTTTLAERILWTACCDIHESGEWFGIVP